MKYPLLSYLLVLCLATVGPFSAYSQSWFASGSAPQSYNMGGNPTTSDSAFIVSTTSPINGFGTWMTTMDADTFRSRTATLKASIKVENVSNYTGLWFRVDHANGYSIAFDNSSRRSPISGTTDWDGYEVTLPVGSDADRLAYGLILSGTGNAYFKDLGFELSPEVWEYQSIGPADDPYSLYAVNEDVVWCGGLNGRYMRTLDGGQTWSSGVVPGAENLVFLVARGFGEDTCYLLGGTFNGQTGGIFKTEDGGQTWTTQYQRTNSQLWFTGLAFWDEQHGVAMSDPINGVFLILRTNDGGQTWTEVPAANIPPAESGEWSALGYTSLVVAGKRHAWFGTAYGDGVGNSKFPRILATKDTGRTWSAFSVPLLSTNGLRGFNSLTFRDTLEGFAAGIFAEAFQGGPRSSTVFRTSDGGNTWEPVTSPPHALQVLRITYVSENNDSVLFAGTDYGTLFSTDKGSTWGPITTDTKSTFGASFVNDSTGWSLVLPEGYEESVRLVKYVGGAPYETDTTTTTSVPVVTQPEMLPNFPNPFDQSTTIPFTVYRREKIELQIFRLDGKLVTTLVDGERNPGTYYEIWQPRNLPNGLYVYRLKIGDQLYTNKLVLQR